MFVYRHCDFQDGVHDLVVGVNESIFFSFVRRIIYMKAHIKRYWMLIKLQNL